MKSQLHGGTPAAHRSLRIFRWSRRPARRDEVGTDSPHAAQPGRWARLEHMSPRMRWVAAVDEPCRSIGGASHGACALSVISSSQNLTRSALKRCGKTLKNKGNI